MPMLTIAELTATPTVDAANVAPKSATVTGSACAGDVKSSSTQVVAPRAVNPLVGENIAAQTPSPMPFRFNLPDKLSKIEKEVLKMTENEGEENQKHGLKDSITGFGQKIIGEIESLAGGVNADPLAQAEGEFNVEVGTIRDDLEEGGVKEDKDQ